MSLREGDVVLLAFPFADGLRSKRRPALIVLDPLDDDILVARVTTSLQRTERDLTLVHWESVGLLRPSVVRLDKLATLDAGLVVGVFGQLHPDDLAAVKSKLRCFW